LTQRSNNGGGSSALRQDGAKESPMEFAAIQLFAAVALWILHTLQANRP
jgi:hypothetical protein